ncbi:Arm DNA-binding domain-containing protein [Halalkalibacter flavus]
MASFRKGGQTWGYAVSHTVNGKTKQYTKTGFKTKAEAQLAASEIESKF